MFKAMKLYYSNIIKKVKLTKKMRHVMILTLIYATIILGISFNSPKIGLGPSLLFILGIYLVAVLVILPFISWYLVYYDEDKLK